MNRRGWPGQLDLCRHANVYMESGGITWLYRHEGPPYPGALKAIKQAKDRVGIEKLEPRIAPSIVLVNPGGNTPQGENANNGQAIEAQNPAGHAPPGHNK